MELMMLIWYAESITAIKFALALAVFFTVLHQIKSNGEWVTTSKSIAAIVVMVFFLVVTPAQKTVYMMAAGYAAQKVVLSETSAVIYNKLITLINLNLDKEIQKHTEGKGK